MQLYIALYKYICIYRNYVGKNAAYPKFYIFNAQISFAILIAG